jgi:hypothetical protein
LLLAAFLAVPLSDAIRPAVFTNNGAVFFWAFMAAWMAMLVSFGRGVAAADVSGIATAAHAIFWMISAVLTALALWLPRVRVEISPAGVRVRETAPLWKRDRLFAVREVSVSAVVENEDTEGTHYTCSLILPNREAINLVQGGSRVKVAAERLRLISDLMNAERRAAPTYGYAKTVPGVTFINGASAAIETTLVDPATNFYRFNPDGAQTTAALGQYIKEKKGWSRIVVVAEDYSFPLCASVRPHGYLLRRRRQGAAQVLRAAGQQGLQRSHRAAPRQG